MGDRHVMLSVIIPMYNMEKYVSRCLDSVLLALDRLNEEAEVLIINDGSTDHSKAIVQMYCQKNSSICLFSKGNGGLSSAKNYGLEKAQGEYVLFIDSDDYIDPDMFCVMFDRLRKEDGDMAVCGIEMVYENEQKNYVPVNMNTIRKDIFSNLLDTGLACSSCNKIVKKALYSGLDFPMGMNNEDMAVTPIVMGRAKRIVYVDQPFYKYYQREGSIQNGAFDERRFVILYTVKLCLKRSEKLDKEKIESIKGALYTQQILAVAYYLIRRQPIQRRYALIKAYMRRVEEMFSDIWEHPWVTKKKETEKIHQYAFRYVSTALLKKQMYALTCVFWSLINLVFK